MLHNPFSHKLHYLLKSEITEIYITHSIRSFITSMIAVFVPIFLIDMGYSLTDLGVYYIVHSIAILLLVKPFINFAAKKGMKRSIIISIPLTIVFFVSLKYLSVLSAISSPKIALIAVSIFAVIPALLYWMGFHLDFAQVHSAKKSARQVSVLHATSIIFSIVGPLLGATIIAVSGFGALFSTIIILSVLAIVPLFFSSELHEPTETSFRNIFSTSERKKHFPYIGEGIREMGAGVFWPVMLYFLAINIQEIGGLYTLTHALLALFTIYIGKISTQKNQHKILRIGTIINSVSLVARTLLKTVSAIAATQGIGAIAFSMVKTPFASIHYNKSQKQGIAHTIFAREIYLHTGKSISAIVVIVMFLWTNNPITTLMTVIIMGALASFSMNSIKED